MFRKRKDANEETMAMGRVVGVRNASPAHRVAQLHEREGEAIAITMQKSFRGMKGRAAKWYWEESAELRNHDFLPSSTANSMARAPRHATSVRSMECTPHAIKKAHALGALRQDHAGPERVHKHQARLRHQERHALGAPRQGHHAEARGRLS